MIEVHNGLSALRVLAKGNKLELDGRVYAMTNDADIVQIGKTDSGKEVHLRTDISIGQWFRLTSQLSENDKMSIALNA